MAAPGANPAQNGVAQSPAVNLIQWVQGTLMEPIVRFLNGNSDGGDFADYVFEGWPDRLVPLQRMTHPQMPGQTGAPGHHRTVPAFRHLADAACLSGRRSSASSCRNSVHGDPRENRSPRRRPPRTRTFPRTGATQHRLI